MQDNPFAEDQRVLIIKELIETEYYYRQSLSGLLESSADAFAVHLQPIVSFSEGLYQLLNACASQSEAFVEVQDQVQGVSDVMSSVLPEMEIVYSQYISVGHGECMAQYEALSKESVTNIKSRLGPSVLDIPSVLLKPLQRVLKYPLFLQDLLKHTSEPNIHLIVERVVNQMRLAMARINSVRNQRETLAHQASKPKDLLHFVSKTISRSTQVLRNKTGYNDSTHDTLIEAIQQKVGRFSQLLDHLKDYVRHWYHQRQILLETELVIALIYEDLFLIDAQSAAAQLLKVRSWKSGLRDEQLSDHMRLKLSAVSEQILTACQIIMQPMNILNMRQRKILDYDSVKDQQDLAKNAKAAYQVYDEVLIREAPLLFQLMEQLIVIIAVNLFKAVQEAFMDMRKVYQLVSVQDRSMQSYVGLQLQSLHAVASLSISSNERKPMIAKQYVGKRRVTANDLHSLGASKQMKESPNQLMDQRSKSASNLNSLSLIDFSSSDEEGYMTAQSQANEPAAPVEPSDVERLMALFSDTAIQSMQPNAIAYEEVKPFKVVTIYPTLKADSAQTLVVDAGVTLTVLQISESNYWCQNRDGRSGVVPRAHCQSI